MIPEDIKIEVERIIEKEFKDVKVFMGLSKIVENRKKILFKERGYTYEPKTDNFKEINYSWEPSNMLRILEIVQLHRFSHGMGNFTIGRTQLMINSVTF